MAFLLSLSLLFISSLMELVIQGICLVLIFLCWTGACLSKTSKNIFFHISHLALAYVCHNFVKASRKTVTGSYVTLRSGFVAISAPRCDECSKVSVIWVEGNAVVPVPAVEHRLSFSAGDRSGLMEGALRVVCFTCSMLVECLKVNGSSWFSVLRAYHHPMAPSNWLPYGDRFQNAKFTVTVETYFYGLLPVKWNRNGVVVCDWDGLGVNHESHWGTFHKRQWLVLAGIKCA